MPVVPKLSIVRVQVLENQDKLVEFRGDLFMSQSSLTDVHTCGISGLHSGIFAVYPRRPPDSVGLHMALGQVVVAAFVLHGLCGLGPIGRCLGSRG